jgi:hypothetical protein
VSHPINFKTDKLKRNEQNRKRVFVGQAAVGEEEAAVTVLLLKQKWQMEMCALMS